MPLLNTTIGGPQLCAWQPSRGICFVQTRSPRHARRLSQRRDGRLIATGVAGGYLKTYAFRHPLSWAVRLIERYTASMPDLNRNKADPS